MASGDFVVDVHGDPENAELQQSDAKQTPVYRVHRKYRLAPTGRAREAPDDTRSDKRYFFAFADKSSGNVRITKPPPDAGDEILTDFVPCPGDAGDEAMADTEEPWVAQSRQLNERVRLEPADIMGWWALIQLQDTIPGLTKAARLEKKVAILRSAAGANPACDALWLALIRFAAQAGADIGPIWDEALRASPSSLMFERYVRASLSSFSEFSIGAVRTRLQQLLSSLSTVDGKLHIMSLWNWVERSAGYDERSTAFGQAAVEFHLFCPAALRGAPFPARIRAFEQFWESEVPRVGEPGAPTWAGWYGRDDIIGDDADAAIGDAAPPVADLRQWFEHEGPVRRRLPLRGADDDEDLERVVIFDDIRPTLFDCDACAVAVHLVDELLAALGVPDALLTRARVVSPADDAVSFRLVDLGPLYEPSTTIPAALADAYKQPVAPGETDCLADLASAVIEAAVGSGILSIEGAAALQLTKLAIEARYLGPKRAAKSVKALLKRDRSNVELCHVLARLQTDPAPIYRSVLGSFAGADWAPPVYCLVWAAVQHAFDHDADLRPWLLLAGDGQPSADTDAPVSAIQLTRARHAVAKKLARVGTDAAWWRLPFGSVFEAAPGLCLALIAVHLEYICAGLQDALAFVHGALVPILPPPGPQLDYVWGRVARLLQWHARRHPASCPPRLTRTVFEPALKSCPLSWPIWDAFIETAPNAAAVRTMFDACIGRLRCDGLYDVPIRLFLYAIVYELTQSSSSSRVHRLFEQALAENCRGVVLLWRLYLRYAVIRGDADGARKILYRAVDQCPGSRPVWFDSIRALIEFLPSTGPGALQTTDLLELVTLMGEKGIRLHSHPPAI